MRRLSRAGVPLAAMVVTLLALVLAPRDLRAHAILTAYLELTESGEGTAVGTWKLPVPSPDAEVHIAGCTMQQTPADGPDGAASRFVKHVTFACEGGLVGREVRVAGLGLTVSEAVVRVLLADGTSISQVLQVRRPAFVIPKRATFGDVLPRYVSLGVHHILSGPDHLLFVLGLVLLLGHRRYRDILYTATMFTLAHSITLSATALGRVQVPSAWAEALIAATLVLLALDIDPRGEALVPRGKAMASAFAFGLVHGFGFAGALMEVGLPKDAVPPALVAFNVGVELGQVGFVAVVVLALQVMARLTRHLPRLREAPAHLAVYAIGVLGMFWFVSRVRLLVTPS